jgi:hypothetical protein
LKQGGLATFEEYIEQQKAYGRDLLEGATNTDEATRAAEDLADATAELSKKQEEIQRRIDARTKSTKEGNEVDKEAELRLKELAKAFDQAQKALGRFTLEGEVSAQVLEEANKLLEKQKELLDERKGILQEQTTEAEQAAAQLQRLIGGVLFPEEGIVNFEDVFEEIFRNVEKLGGSASEQYENLLKEVERLGGVEQVRNKIGEESLDILQDYFQTNIELQESLRQYNVDAAAAGQEVVDLNIDIAKVVKDISDIRENADATLERESVTQEKIFNLVAGRLFPQTELNNLTDEQKETIDEITKSLLEQEKIYQGIDDINAELEKKTKAVKENIEGQKAGLDGESFKNLRQFIIDNADSIDAIEETFKTISENSENLTKEQIDNINTLIENIKINNFVDDIDKVTQNVVQLFTSVTGQISQLIAGAASLQLEQLAYQEAQTLSTIGDATEEARAERLKVEEEFAKKRFEVEKQARLSELQFTLADTIANGAAAYISALGTPPPAGFILAQLIGGITAQQVGLIRSQIGFTKSTQYIGRRGGLISGADHENGGVMASGGLVLEGGEAIINRQAVSQFSDILNQVQLSTNGRPLVGDDSRIVEEIRKQNQRPIKTYVLDQDIQDTRKINSKLEQISRL